MQLEFDHPDFQSPKHAVGFTFRWNGFKYTFIKMS